MKQKYKIGVINYYDDLDISIDLGIFRTTKRKAENIAFGIKTIILYKDKLKVNRYDRSPLILGNECRSIYQFSVCTKILPPPIDVSTLSQVEKDDLLTKTEYMVMPNDMREVKWSLSEAFDYLKESNLEKEYFVFSSSGYYVRPI